MKTVFISIRMLVIFTLITGVIYPLSITLIAQTIWPQKANGSIIIRDDKIVGSELIAQKFISEKYFHPRPSAVDYATTPSGASNLAVTSQKFVKFIQSNTENQKTILGKNPPDCLLTTSASGIDPHITPEAAYFQVDHVVKARNLSEEQTQALTKLIEANVEHPVFGFIGGKIVNVLKLNLALDKDFP